MSQKLPKRKISSLEVLTGSKKVWEKALLPRKKFFSSQRITSKVVYSEVFEDFFVRKVDFGRPFKSALDRNEYDGNLGFGVMKHSYRDPSSKYTTYFRSQCS